MGEFPRRLRRAMNERDMTAKQVAGAADMAHNTVLAYMRGERNPTMRNIVALCRCLGVSADWLLGLRG